MSILKILAGAVALSIAAAPAFADTILKQQMAEVYQGSVNNGNFAPYIGSLPPFGGTSAIDVSHVGGNLSLTIHTAFTGSNLTNGDCFGSICAHAADIALSLDGGATYGYGISLGYDRNGLAAGLYQVTSWLTSQMVWAPAGSGFLYGGAWETCSVGCTNANAHLADTVINGGTKLAAASVVDNGDGTISISTNTAIDFDYLFWGTADCSNDPIAGAIPEPFSLALFGIGLAGLGLVKRR